MGKEASCVVRHGGARVEGKAHLDADEMVFRSPTLRLRIPRTDLVSVEAAEGVLRVAFSGGEASFELGAQAERWAHELLHPKSRAEKLGARAGQRAWLKGVTDEALPHELSSRGVELIEGVRPEEVDLAFLQVDAPRGLSEVAKVAGALARTGALWVVTPRGVEGLRDVDVMAAAKAAGLVDVKVVRFSGTHTALKLVVPKAAR